MRNHSNTLFITGGGAGIGRGLAEAFHHLGNRVIIGGRREAILRETCAANPGMSYIPLDVRSLQSIRDAVRTIREGFPETNILINNAGLQRPQRFATAGGVDDAAMVEEIETNLLGVMRMCAEFIPQLAQRPEAAIVNVSSGLAFVPLAAVPVYCATKAAVHSFTVSLRHQLRDAGVKVIELIPPYVDTSLDKGRRRPDAPTPMPLADFITGAMAGLGSEEEEIAVGGAQFLRAAAGDQFAAVFARMNG